MCGRNKYHPILFESFKLRLSYDEKDLMKGRDSIQTT